MRREDKRVIKGAIFDVDGTLLDSMSIWMDAGARYLRSIHVEPETNLSEVLWNMSIPEGVAYVKEHYSLSLSEEEITGGILSTVRDFYLYEAPLKPGVEAFLEQLNHRGIPMVIATSSDKRYVKAAFARTGIDRYFKRIFTCEEMGASKMKPKIYKEAGKYLGYPPEEIFVFEDVIHAVQSAKKAHFPVVGLYDEASEKDREAMQAECDVYLKDFTEADIFWNYVEEG